MNWKKSAPGRRHSKCKGPELGIKSAYLRDSESGAKGVGGPSGRDWVQREAGHVFSE